MGNWSDNIEDISPPRDQHETGSEGGGGVGGWGVASKPVFVLSFTYNWECYHIFFIRVKYKKGWEPPLILYEDIFVKAKFEIFH